MGRAAPSLVRETSLHKRDPKPAGGHGWRWAIVGAVSEESAFDVNEMAWDPARDSTNERVSLLRELDATPVAHVTHLLDPAHRTVGGKPLGTRRTELLLRSTYEDLEVLANQVNARAEYDDDDEVASLAAAIRALEQLLGAHRPLKSDTDDATVARMPVEVRREARAIQLRIERLRLERYQPTTLRRRDAGAAIPALTRALDAAVAAGDQAEAARLSRLLDRAQSDLHALDQH